MPLERLRARRDDGNNTTVIKEALDAVARYGGPVRPLAALTREDRADLAEAIRNLEAAARSVPTSPRNSQDEPAAAFLATGESCEVLDDLVVVSDLKDADPEALSHFERHRMAGVREPDGSTRGRAR